MRVLILWADPASTNLGVQALAGGTAALARMAWQNADVTFLNYGTRQAPMPVGNPRALARELVRPRRGLVEWLRGFDIVLDTRGGDSFSDIYGFDRHCTMGLLAEAVRKSGVPYVLSPQTIGPFSSRRARIVARRSLRLARLTMSRDPVSASAAAALGRPVDVLTTDVVFALPTPQTSHVHDVLLNVSGLLWQPSPHVNYERYREIVQQVHQDLTRAGRRVTLLAHVIDSPVPDNDVPAVSEFGRLVGSDDIIVPTSLGEARVAIAGAQLVIASRMHACLNALSAGVPALALAYSRKFEPLMRHLAWDSVFDLRDDVWRPDVVDELSAPGLAERAGRAQQIGRELIEQAATELASIA